MEPPDQHGKLWPARARACIALGDLLRLGEEIARVERDLAGNAVAVLELAPGAGCPDDFIGTTLDVDPDGVTWADDSKSEEPSSATESPGPTGNWSTTDLRALLNYLGDSPPGTGPRLVLEPESAPQMSTLAPGPGGPADAAMTSAEIAIGPEGGFASEELEAFRVAGFSQVGLGPRVLRAETAAIAAVVWLQARLGDM